MKTLLRAACLGALAAAAAFSHPTGVSRIDFHIDSGMVEATIDVNTSDLLFSLGVNAAEYIPKDEIGLVNDRIALYFQTRIPVKFDKPSAPARVLDWSKAPGDPSARMDSLQLTDTTVVMRLGWPVPEGAARMNVQVKLFAELQLQPLSHVRFHWKDKQVARRFLTLEGRADLPLAPDSLETLAARLAAGPGGESSPEATAGEESVFVTFIKQGFLHIIPEGKDHILFVLGLFFFSSLMRPLLIQVTAFTIAHSITLGLAMMGVFSLPASIVEPLIALSISVVALENIFFRKLRPSRWVIVFGFGLIHGMGFAGVLRNLGLPEDQFLTTLIGFNIGVEIGQLAVIALAAAATFWAWRKPWYFRFVVIPVSAAIALTGLFWTVQRLVGG